MMRRLRGLLILLGVTAAIAVAGWYFTRPQPVAVTLGRVDTGRVERTVANTRAATVTACRRAKLAPPTGGQIAKLNVREGDRVKAGQVLLELWNQDLLAREHLARDQLLAAQAHAQEVCLSADLAERDAQRAQQLKDKGFISMERVDRAVSEAKARRAGCSAARADIEQSQSRIAAARADLSRTFLRAPFDGVVAEVSGELGEFSTPSPPGIPTPPAIDLIDDSCLYVTAPIDEVDAPAIRLKMPARITVDAFSQRKFPAHVRRIAPYALDREKQARTVDVEVEFNNPKETEALLVGYSADVEIILEARDGVLRIPTPALQEGNRVLVHREADGRLEERRIDTGLSNWEHTEVRSGLAAGERIVVSLEKPGVKPGVKARPDNSTGPAGSAVK
jgi:HlyD family secretion protein